MTDRTKDRVYVVEVEGQRPRLVRATFAHIAQRHVIAQLVTARVASKDDIVDLMTAGVKCENAADPMSTNQLPLGNGGWEQRTAELTGFENTGA